MDAAAETLKPEVDAAKATVEQFTTAANTAFKDGVEKSLAALAEANTHSKKNLEAAVASVSAAAKALATAKTPQELFELQTTFAKSAFETYVSELGKMSETFQASVKASFLPINERVSDTVGKLQATR